MRGIAAGRAHGRFFLFHTEEADSTNDSGSDHRAASTRANDDAEVAVVAAVVVAVVSRVVRIVFRATDSREGGKITIQFVVAIRVGGDAHILVASPHFHAAGRSARRCVAVEILVGGGS